MIPLPSTTTWLQSTLDTDEEQSHPQRYPQHDPLVNLHVHPAKRSSAIEE
jgi:hypothetical protein